jgi:very-short-patch-repair endonuclease
MTEPEKKLWEYILTNTFGARFRRQHPFGKYILDFYCHSKRISIEIDGPNHLETKQFESDVIRTSFVNSMGVQELRFTNDQVLNSFEIVSRTILNAIQQRNIGND